MKGSGPAGTVGTWYPEHENLNSYRNYPFAETANLDDTVGVALAQDVFVDAFLYPVVSEATELSLTRFRMPDGYVEVSGDNVLISGTYENGTVELYDSRGRHAGSLVCGSGWEREKASGRDRTFEGLAFASTTCSPVIYAGVLSVSDEGETMRTTRRNIVFEGDGKIVPHLENNKLWFDALPGEKTSSYMSPIRSILFVNEGKTLIRADEGLLLGNNTAQILGLATEGIHFSREDICWQAHKEDAVAVVSDTCEEEDAPACPPVEIPEVHDQFLVCADGMGFINVIATDYPNYKNPIHVATVAGQSIPQTANITPGLSVEEMVDQGSRLAAKPAVTGNGIRISIPGLKG